MTLNYGLRFEHEDGLRERDDGITVAFDRTLTPPGPLGNITVNGQPVRGGLVYAGQNGANTYQGDPPALKVSPRVGAVYSINTRTVIRGGYGLYWAPFNAPAPDTTNYGQVGYNQESLIQQGQFRPTVSLTNPYPNGLLQPVGNANGALTNVGQQVIFVDQDRTAPKVHQYSVDVARELGGSIAVGFEYAGATGRDLLLGGTRQLAAEHQPARSTAPGARNRIERSRSRTRSSVCRRDRASTSPAPPSRVRSRCVRSHSSITSS